MQDVLPLETRSQGFRVECDDAPVDPSQGNLTDMLRHRLLAVAWLALIPFMAAPARASEPFRYPAGKLPAGPS